MTKFLYPFCCGCCCCCYKPSNELRGPWPDYSGGCKGDEGGFAMKSQQLFWCVIWSLFHPSMRPSVRATSSLSRTYSFFLLPPISFECSHVLSDLTILPSQMKQNKRYVRPFVRLSIYIHTNLHGDEGRHTYICTCISTFIVCYS